MAGQGTDHSVDEEEGVEEFEEVPADYIFTELPKQMDFGSVARCPRCRGKGSEPGTKPELEIKCRRCNGFGVIPNKGVIPYRRQ